MKKEKREQLKEQLKEFGLNPSQWNLQKLTKHSGELTHKFDKDLILQGQIQKNQQGLGWTQLSLIDKAL